MRSVFSRHYPLSEKCKLIYSQFSKADKNIVRVHLVNIGNRRINQCAAEKKEFIYTLILLAAQNEQINLKSHRKTSRSARIYAKAHSKYAIFFGLLSGLRFANCNLFIIFLY